MIMVRSKAAGRCVVGAVAKSYSRGLVHCHHGKKPGSMLENMVLEKELRVLPLALQAAESEMSY